MFNRCLPKSQLLLVISIALWLISIPATTFSAQKEQRLPIYVEADSASYNEKTGISIYQGNVKATQGKTVIIANTVTAYYSNQLHQLEKIIATGKPAQYRTVLDPNKHEFIAIGDMIHYYLTTHWIKFIGAAKATQGKDSFAGPQLDYNTKEKIVVSPLSNQGRSKIIIQPQQK